MNCTRDNRWLEDKLNEVWTDYFSDVRRINPIIIKFGRRAKCRLGSIRLTKEKISFISINSILKDSKTPEYLVLVTIAHELIHYAHGFSSLHEKKYQNPHQGGVVTKEIKVRGLGKQLVNQKKWLEANWVNYLNANYPELLTIKKRKIKNKYLKIWF